jgi:hypothetical protein
MGERKLERFRMQPFGSGAVSKIHTQSQFTHVHTGARDRGMPLESN